MLEFELLLKKIETHNIGSGDLLVLQGGSDILSLLVRLFTGSKFVHTAMLVKLDDLFFVIEAEINRGGYPLQIMPLVFWVKKHQNDVVYLAKKPSTNKFDEQKLKKVILTMSSIRPYGLKFLAVVYFLQDWLGICRPQIMTKTKPIICSSIIQEVWEAIGLIKRHYYASPGDLVYLIGGEDALIPINLELIKQYKYKKESSRLSLRNDYLHPDSQISPMGVIFRELIS